LEGYYFIGKQNKGRWGDFNCILMIILIRKSAQKETLSRDFKELPLIIPVKGCSVSSPKEKEEEGGKYHKIQRKFS